jgi:acyl transferase domain-containing protein
MNHSEPTIDYRTLLEKAYLQLRSLRTELQALEQAQLEPIAIIGIGCRFPQQTDTPEKFWQLLRNGIDTVTEIPADRFSADTYHDTDAEALGKSYTRHGSFLEQIDQFDPHFFGIAPREAVGIEPQQRLLLEVTWEAIEHAGIAPTQLSGSKTGIYVGLFMVDYDRLSFYTGEVNIIDAYRSLGMIRSMAAGRLAYFLDVHGPALQLDTTCSSALLGVHLACQSLRTREINLALAGGVNLMLIPEIFIGLSKLQALSPDGRSKAFAANANGYGRGEGCGMVVLKRLNEAIADGDNILAVIRGSAANHDGRSNGLSAPNGAAQEAVIREALTNAQVQPQQIQYLEAHGTGTPLGDPIEVLAMGEVFGQEREQPLLIGSVKSNIGHIEPAAGIAGLIKVVLALQQQQIPPHLHFHQPNPYIPWDKLPITVPTQLTAWPSQTGGRLAGISSFGMSGTNVHVIVGEAPPNTPLPHTSLERPWHLLTLSAKTPEALMALVKRYQTWLTTHGEITLADLCHTANVGRTHFAHRIAISADTTTSLANQLHALSSNDIQPSSRQVPKLAFLFTGQGSQYVHMGQKLYATQPTFRQTLDHCAELLRTELPKPLLEVLGYFAQPAAPTSSLQSLDDTQYTQPALFAIEYALAKLWESWGVKPAVVMGHSVGEYVAACLAGVFSLQDGLKLIAARGRLMQTRCQSGSMLVIAVTEAQAKVIIQDLPEISIAAINGVQNTVIAGNTATIMTLKNQLDNQGIKTKLLNVSHAFHSPLMEPMLAEFEQIASTITYHTPTIPLCSNVTGQLVTYEVTSPNYWHNHVRQTVRFAQSINTLFQQGYEHFLEIGSKPSLLGMARQCVPENAGTWLASLRPGHDDWQTLLQSLAELYQHGVAVDWRGFDKDYSRRRVILPTYPFQRQRYWVENTSNRRTRAVDTANHPLLGQPLYLAGSAEIRFETQINAHSPAYLAHHQVFNTVILPAAAYVEMVLVAGKMVLKTPFLILEEVSIQQALILSTETLTTVQIVLTPNGEDSYAFQIFSLESAIPSSPKSAAPQEWLPKWLCHVTGKVKRGQDSRQLVDLSLIKMECTHSQEMPAYYQQWQQRGIDYGNYFQAIQQLWWCEGKAIGEIQLPTALHSRASSYILHPILLDASLQALGATVPTLAKDTYIPIAFSRLYCYGAATTHLWSVATLSAPHSDKLLSADLQLVTADGQLLASIEGLKLKKVNPQSLLTTQPDSLQDWFYDIQWQPQVHFGLPVTYLPTTAEFNTTLLPALTNSLPALEATIALLPQLERLSLDYIWYALTQLGWQWQVQQRFTTANVVTQLSIIDSQHRLFKRCLAMLAEVQILQALDDESWQVMILPSCVSLEVLRERTEQLLTLYPNSRAAITIFSRCAPHLADVWQGKINPLELLFPQGDATLATEFYQRSPELQELNGLIRLIISKALSRLPSGRGIQLLEIGAGTGGTTDYLLPLLSVERCRYVFTDISPQFIHQAQQRFQEYSCVSYQPLDIEKFESVQSVGEQSYDFILAANVLHATKDLSVSLTHVYNMLAPGGMLVVLESITPWRWLDLTFGLTVGWWWFTDRRSYPLLAVDQWYNLLQNKGFIDIASYTPDALLQRQAVGQAVITARKPMRVELAYTDSSASRSNQQQALPTWNSSLPRLPGTWLIFMDNQGVGKNLVIALRAQGEICREVYFQDIPADANALKLDVNSPAEFERLLASLPPLRGIIYGWSLNTLGDESLTVATLTQLQRVIYGGSLHLIQAMLATGLKAIPLYLLTQGAVVVSPALGSSTALFSSNSDAVSLNTALFSTNSDTVHLDTNDGYAIAQATLWGLGRVADLEHAELRCIRIDLDEQATLAQKVQSLLAEIQNHALENQVAFRQSLRYVARLHRAQCIPTKPLLVRKDGTYLITGGLGGLGLLVAKWLVEQGARNLVLIGRREPSPVAREQLANLTQLGAIIRIVAADVADAQQMFQLINEIQQQLPPLRGVIHSAGVIDDALLPQQSWVRFEKVMSSKIKGTWLLHTLTRDLPLDFFVLFSSIASLLGSIAQANHAAANSFMDRLAHYRRSQGLAGLSINWGLWADIGAITQLDSYSQQRFAEQGVTAISPIQGIAILERLMRTGVAQVGVLPIKWATYFQQDSVSKVPIFLTDIATSIRDKLATTMVTVNFKQQLKSASATEVDSLLTQFLQDEVAKVLKTTQVDNQEALNRLGLDSLMAVDLRNRLRKELDVDIPVVKLMEGVSIIELVAQLKTELVSTKSTTVASPIVTREEELLAKVDELTDEEVEALLREQMSKVE